MSENVSSDMCALFAAKIQISLCIHADQDFSWVLSGLLRMQNFLLDSED